MDTPHVFDLGRIFIGDTSPALLLEIAFRTTVLFAFTLLMLRLLGQRGISQLSTAEFTLIIALGSAVGDPMFYAGIPLVHGMVVISLIVLFQRGVALVTLKNRGLEKVLEGTAQRLVANGRIDLEGMKQSQLSVTEIYAELRHSSVEQLGEVRRAYLEMDGQVSVFTYPPDKVKAGLPLLPPDAEGDHIYRGDDLAEHGVYACYGCGDVRLFDDLEYDAPRRLGRCPRCGADSWLPVPDADDLNQPERHLETNGRNGTWKPTV